MSEQKDVKCPRGHEMHPIMVNSIGVMRCLGYAYRCDCGWQSPSEMTEEAACLAATATLPNLPLSETQLIGMDATNSVWSVNGFGGIIIMGASSARDMYLGKPLFTQRLLFARNPTQADIENAMFLRGQTPCDTICDPQHAPVCTQECINASDVVNPVFKSEKDDEMDPVRAAEILADFASGGFDYKKYPHVLVALRMAHRALINSVPYVLTKEQIRERILTLGPDKFQPLYIQFRGGEYKNAPRWRDCYNVNSLVGGVPSDSDYGKKFVFWSALPSDDQMNAVEWED